MPHRFPRATLLAGIVVLVLAGGGVAIPDSDDGDPIRLAKQEDQERGGFTTSPRCARCHSNADRANAMRDASNRDVAPFDLWQGTMMANSARDPLWRAFVSAEVASTPSRAEAIQRKCLGCHAPMLERGSADDAPPPTLEALYAEDAPAQVGLDGVSCTVCHQITPEGLGEPESFGGQFTIGDDARIYGPHARPFPMPMRHHTGYTPVEGRHVLRSSLCASCHTLFTHGFAEDGTPGEAEFPEQTPYLEWRNSAFDQEREAPGEDAASCQDCHAPTDDVDGLPIETRIARNPGGRDFGRVEQRRPFGRHIFVGGNTLVPAILRDHRDELRPQASDAALDATIARTKEQLRERTATLAIAETSREGEALRVRLRIENRAGHKLPTGIPVRRVWLRVRVRDAGGETIFASGEHDAAGRILGADGTPTPSELAGGPIEPHRDRIGSPDEVVRWESIMADAEGRPTFLLMRATGWIKDDRLLPRGWSADHPDAAATAPVGTDGDPTFGPGGDEVLIEVGTGASKGPLTVEATLLYQTLSARWAAELFTHDTREIRAFRRYWEESDRTPTVIDEVSTTVP